MAPRQRLGIVLALALVVGGCSTPIEPDRGLTTRLERLSPALAETELLAQPPEAGLAFYPLELGNRWQFARRFRTQFFPRGVPPHPALVVESQVERVLSCIDDPYTIEASTEVISTDQGPLTTHTWARYRQDADGLFQSRLPLDQPPTCGGTAGVARISRASVLARVLAGRPEVAARASLESELSRIQRCLELAPGIVAGTSAGESVAGVLVNEATVLSYPLHPLKLWTVVNSPSTFALTEAVEILELPAGRFVTYRVRVHVNGLMGPQDRMHLWVSRSGFLKLEARFLRPLILNGVVGNLLIEESEILQELQLVATLP